MKNRKTISAYTIICFSIMGLLSLFFLAMLVIAILTSVKSDRQVLFDPFSLPKPFVFKENYSRICLKKLIDYNIYLFYDIMKMVIV